MAAIELSHITKTYDGGVNAVDDLNIDIGDGEFLVLVGPSGCGKSTTLMMVAGLEDITDGELVIDGEVVNALAPKERDVAVVFQDYALYPHMSVRDNMSFALKIAKLPKAEVTRRVEEAASVLDLTEVLDRKPAQLSGGQRQRVAMGRAIVREPKAFLMDEPLSNLDAKLRVQMRAEIGRLQRSLEVTTIYVTHDQSEAMTLGDRVAVLRGGVLQQLGTPKELYLDPANVFVAGFIGSPRMNLVPGRLADGGVHTALGDATLPDQVRQRLERAGAERDVIVGIRPEHVVAREANGSGSPIQVLEWMGSQVFAHVDPPSGDGIAEVAAGLGLDEIEGSSTEHVIVQLDPDTDAREGDTVAVTLDADRLYLFDATSGERLVSQA
jgi:multiple sugar transport system ATP-binding protein